MKRITRVVPAVLALATAALACEAPTVSRTTEGDTVDAGWVTGAAAAALDGSGRFRLPPARAEGADEITAAQALRLTEAWRSHLAPFVLGYLSRGAGAPIDLAQLAPCGRTYYASSLVRLGAEAPMPARKAYGSWYLVTLCGAGGVAQVSLAVSALNTDIGIENGRIVFPRIHGNEFHWAPIAPDVGAAPLSPESAARAAFELSGRPVTAVPTLTVPPRPFAPQLAMWRIELDAPVDLTVAEGQHVATQILYARVGIARDAPVLYVAAAEQPAKVAVPIRQRRASTDTRALAARVETGSVSATRVAARPIELLRVVSKKEVAP